MTVKFTNNATSLLSSGVDAVTTTIAITSGDEGNFPTLGAGDWCPITVVDGAGNMEIMRCTARSGVTLTVVRAQEGTTAKSFSAGARVDVRLTSAALEAALAAADRLSTGEVDNDVLPERLQETVSVVADADALTATGTYRTDGSTTNAPAAVEGYLWHITLDADTMTQEFLPATPVAASDTPWVRRKSAGTWGDWGQPYVALARDAVPIGVTFEYALGTLPTGRWLWVDGRTIGSAASGATALASALALELFTGLWESYSNTLLPIQTSAGAPSTRGANAAADFAANKRMPLLDDQDRVVAGRGNMSGTSANRLTGLSGGVDGDVLGAVGGSEAHTLTTAQLPVVTPEGTIAAVPDHVHKIAGNAGPLVPKRSERGSADVTSVGASGADGSIADVNSAAAGGHTPVFTGVPFGSGAAHNNVQPTIIRNKIIRY